MRSFKYCFVCCVLIFSQVYGQYDRNVTNVATTAAPFLQIGVGARAIAMGGAFVATADDPSTMYWNPAGISNLKSLEAIFMHSNWLADISFDYAGLIIPLGRIGTLGANITTLNMGEMEVRTVDRPEGTGERFDASDMAIGVAYGVSLTDRFSIGFNFKYITQRIWKESASGFAVDIGTFYRTPLEGLRIGANLSNFGTDLRMRGDDLLVYHDIDPYQLGNNDRIFAELQTQSWPLPLTFQLGLAYDMLHSERHLLTIATDAVHPNNNTESMNLGLEYGFLGKYFLRSGYRNLFLEDSEEGLTFGGGILIDLAGNFTAGFQYAYADFGRLENTQRFSVVIQF